MKLIRVRQYFKIGRQNINKVYCRGDIAPLALAYSLQTFLLQRNCNCVYLSTVFCQLAPKFQLYSLQHDPPPRGQPIISIYLLHSVHFSQVLFL